MREFLTLCPLGSCRRDREADSPGSAGTTNRSGRQRPSFSVPRLHRGVHRPAAAALRALARGQGLGGWPGLSPAAAVARRFLAG